MAFCQPIWFTIEVVVVEWWRKAVDFVRKFRLLLRKDPPTICRKKLYKSLRMNAKGSQNLWIIF